MRLSHSLWIIAILLILIQMPLFGQNMTAASDFQILRSSSDQMQLRFQLPEWKLETSSKGSLNSQKVSVADHPYLFIDETETLPIFSATIAVPYSGGVTMDIQNRNSTVTKGVKLDFDPVLRTERTSGRHAGQLYPAQLAAISEPQILRDFRIVTVNVYPFIYDQDKGELIVNKTVDVILNFNDQPSVNEMPAPVKISQNFEKIYRGLILNYDQMINRDTTYQNPVMLVIYGNYTDATYLSIVNNFVAWKQQKGYKVTAVSTATTGTTAANIKTYIQNAYNTWTDKPEYLVLIGDDTGTIYVPTFNTYMDYQYTWLAGGDNLGDMVIGRISVSTTEELNTYYQKMIYMDKDIDLATASWLERILLVSDTYHSGISTVYTNNFIHDVSYAANPDYTYNDLRFDSASPNVSGINSALMAGDAFYNYRGYIGMSGWPSYISSLANTYQLFHAVFITCNTGSWGGGTSTTESVVRKGTSVSLGGAMTAIGMATSSTHTPMNNCLNVGIFHGIYDLGMRGMGEPMLYGKLYLNAIYGVSNPTYVLNFSQYCNLIGDPTVNVYVGIPGTFNVTAPTSMPAGSSGFEVTVKDASNIAVEGASVTLKTSTGVMTYGFTDSRGKVYLSYANTTTGDLTLTVNKGDFKPTVNTVTLAAAGGIVFNTVTIDDNSTGSSVGNNNGVANAAETIEMTVNLRNTGSSSAAVSGTVACTDPFITLTTTTANFGTIAAGATANNVSPIVFAIAGNCPDNHIAVFNLTISGGQVIPIPVTIRNGQLSITATTFVGSTGNIINPGETFPMTLTLNNSGGMDLSNLTATISTSDVYMEIIDASGSYGTIAQGASLANTGNTFSVKPRINCVDGMISPMLLTLTNSSGYSQTIPFSITIGQTTITDPLGQDAYGYLIFDEGDTSYDQCPEYNWIGISPSEGGTGTALALTDPGAPGDEGDQVGAVSIQTVTLPFPFTFYGVEYQQASISSNGFIAFGDTDDSDWRNWRLPDAGGPNPMIAVFWDDLDIVTGGGVYTYHNTAEHYYVVEWYNLASGYDGTTPESFQAILYDPDFYPTHTGDGQIKLQYKNFSNIDIGNGDSTPHGNYATIGIKNETGTVGLEYTYGNTYPTAALPLSSQKSLFITTRDILSNTPYLAVDQTIIYDENENGHMEPGEIADMTLVLGNRGLQSATNVTAVISSDDPYVQVLESTASFGTAIAQQTTNSLSYYAIQIEENCPADHVIHFNVAVSADQGTWNLRFALTVRTPNLQIGNLYVNELSGNNNGILDPGETANIAIMLNNLGLVASPAGSASITCSNPGITINTGTTTFTAIAGSGSAVLNFNITASPSIDVGTAVGLNISAVAGEYSVARTETVAIGIIQETFESGDFNTYPWVAGGSLPWVIDTTTPYAGSYSAKSGAINHSQNSILQTTRILSTSGTLTFYYKVSSESGYDYLKFYIDDQMQSQFAGTVDWTMASHTLSAGTHVLKWEYMKDTSVSSGSDCAWIDNIVFPASTGPSSYSPPTGLTATPGNSVVSLTWIAPLSGTPTGYKVFRNSALLATVTGLTYTDNAVTNGTTYAYYLKAVYAGGESDATATVNATPYAPAPQNLTATSSNLIVTLNWLAPATGTPANYRVYRNSTYLATTTNLTYSDLAVSNGTTYDYYVTATYTVPVSESGPSNIISATPRAIAPTNLTALEGNAVVDLFWTAAGGRGNVEEPALSLTTSAKVIEPQVIIGSDTSASSDRSISGYRIYRNGSAIATTTTTTYQDATVTNNVSYTYYVTTIYTSPTGESAPSNSVTVVPSANADVFVTIGAGTSTQTYPMDRYYNYSTHEAIYLASEIAVGGEIKTLSYYKGSGTDVNPIENVSIYMKHTTDTTLSAGTYSLDGYTLVYNGSYANTSTADWMTATLNPRFAYDGTSNLQILVIKGFQAYLNTGYAMWTFTPTATTRARQQRSDTAQPTTLVASTNLPNIRFRIEPAAVLNPPVNLTATPSNRTVALAWEVPLAGTPISYNLYRDGSLLINLNQLYYYDINVTNGTQYSYYVSAVYAEGESGPSTTVYATPNLPTNSGSFVILSGSLISAGNNISPINNAYKNVHGQAVYTAAELNAVGIIGPITITHLGFYINTAPNLALANFQLRMKHTTATNVAAWQTGTFTTVYTNTSYMPIAGGYQMLQLTTPFEWNGTSNIVLDHSFGTIATTTQTGTIQYTNTTSGYRWLGSDTTPVADTYSGGSLVTRRPNIQLTVAINTTGALMSTSTSSITFNTVEIGTTSTQQFTITNTGDNVLAGTISTPTGYTVAQSSREDSGFGPANDSNMSRNTLMFDIAAGSAKTYTLTFAPTDATTYNGNVVISSNATTNPTRNIAVSGTGMYATLASPSVSATTGASSVTLSWTAVPNATQYRVYRADTPNGTYSLIGTVSATQYIDSSRTCAFYYVIAVR